LFGRACLKFKIQIAEDLTNHSIKNKLKIPLSLYFFAFLIFAPSGKSQAALQSPKNGQISKRCRPPGQKKVPTVT
jgi:hypothetical protein